MKEKLIDSFFRYLAIPSQSNPNNPLIPSSNGQYDLAKLLEQELISLGLDEVHLQENSILTAKLKGNTQNKKAWDSALILIRLM